MMGIWSDIERALSPDVDDRELAGRIAMAIQGGVPVAMTQTALMKASDAAIAALYASLERTSPAPTCKSRNSDPSWLVGTDICWINIRASAIDDRPGSFLRASKLLPAISSGAILLAPFHPVQFDLVYAPETMTIVDPGLADPALSAAGISPAIQLRALVSACGLLGKSVGYELLPYVSQFSRIAMERPGLFRWVALDESRTSLAYANPDCPYLSSDRQRDAGLVADLAAAAESDCGVATFRKHEDDTPEQSAAKDKAYYTAIRLCIENGLWPVPAHARRGVGIPSFLSYDGRGDFPVFSYRDADGLDIGEDAYGVVAPFAFYDNVPPNTAPAGPLPRNPDAIDYYSHVFSYWRDSFGFDFVRYNAVDRLFDETVDEAGLVPLSDRPTPEVVAKAIQTSRTGAPGVGAIAARKGAEILAYSELGFDLTMGNEAMKRIDAPLVSEAFSLYDTLVSLPVKARPVSVCFAVDVPESGAPRLWGSPLARVMGPERMRLRHGMARFLSVGRGRRPLFETMGFQDGSTGLYEAGLSTRGLDWADNADFAAGYAAMERLYNRLRPFLDAGSIESRSVEDGYAWWQIRGEGRQKLLVVVASLETAGGLAPGHIDIPIDPAWGDLEGKAYRLPDSIGVRAEAKRTLSLDLGFLDMLVVELEPVFY